MAHAAHAHDPDKYYIPHGSKWPAVGAAALFITMLGTAAAVADVGLTEEEARELFGGDG